LPADLVRVADEVVPALAAAGVLDRPADAGTLRARLGFGVPENRYATTADDRTPADHDLIGSAR